MLGRDAAKLGGCGPPPAISEQERLSGQRERQVVPIGIAESAVRADMPTAVRPPNRWRAASVVQTRLHP